MNKIFLVNYLRDFSWLVTEQNQLEWYKINPVGLSYQIMSMHSYEMKYLDIDIAQKFQRMTCYIFKDEFETDGLQV